MLKPMDPESSKYLRHETGIQRTIDEIERGNGYYEPDIENRPPIKTAHLPLLYFIAHLEKNEYPHPCLLMYLSSVFKRILDGANPNHALGLKRRPGRPRLDDDAILRNERMLISLSVYFQVHHGKNPTTLTKALRTAARKHAMSVESVEADYYRDKKEFELGVEIGKKWGKKP